MMSQDKENFKEFVQMKRDLVSLQEENLMLRAKFTAKKLKPAASAAAAGDAQQLPSLQTQNGHATTYKRLNSATGGRDRVRPVPSYAMFSNS